MLTSPEFVPEDGDDIAALVQQHPWAMVASAETMRSQLPAPDGERT